MLYVYAFLAMLSILVFAFAMFAGPVMIALELCTMGQMFGAMAVSAVVGLFVIWRMERE